MSRVRDNWERLVAATLDREKLRELALASSMETSFSSSVSAPAPALDSLFHFNFRSAPLHHQPPGKSYIAEAILLADQVVTSVSKISASLFKQECLEIKSTAGKVALLLRDVARTSHKLYDRPTCHVMNATVNVLKNTISLLLKCRGIKRVFTNVTAASLQDILCQLECSIANISWLLHNHQYRGLPPIADDEPVLFNIWELIAILHTGSVENRCNAVVSLVSLARESEGYRALITEEGGIQPLLALVQEGTLQVQENAVTVIVLLGKENWEVIDDEVRSVFMRILEGPQVKLQGMVAWAVSELPGICRCYDDQYKFIYLLGRLAFKTLPEDAKAHFTGGHDLGDEIGDYIKTMATRGLWQLARKSSRSCVIIAMSREILLSYCFFLEKGPKEARYNSAMALMEITAGTEQDVEMRKSAFKSNSPACKAMVDQLLCIITKAESDILVPCVKIISNLVRTFNAAETRMIRPLVNLLGDKEAEVSREACIALIGFACSNNNLHLDHSKAIVNAGAVNFLVQLVYFGEQTVHRPALMLLFHIALNARKSEIRSRSQGVKGSAEELIGCEPPGNQALNNPTPLNWKLIRYWATNTIPNRNKPNLA